jgi:hypothetical protein
MAAPAYGGKDPTAANQDHEDDMTDQPPTTTDDVRPGPGWCDHDNEDHAYTMAPCTREQRTPPPTRV